MLDTNRPVENKTVISVGVRWLAGSFVILAFLPYAAVPLGNSTNVSLAALFAAILAVRLMKSPKMSVLIIVCSLVPFVASLFRLFTNSSGINANAYFTAAFGALTFFGSAAAFQILRERMAILISTCIALSSGIAIFQKFVFLDRGIVPWLEFYNLPGYASVASNAQLIGLYIRRPFGLFPEPSFLAGTLALASAGLIILIAHHSLKLNFLYLASLTLAMFTIFLSDSGSGIVCIVILAAAVLIPFVRRHKAVLLLLPGILVVAGWLAFGIATNRQSVGNTSWNDRLASIVAGGRLWLADTTNFLVGVGRGMVPSHFQDGSIFSGGITVYSNVPDIYSVLGRYILENGLLFGVPFIVWMSALLLRAGGRRANLLGTLAVILWLVVAGLTISYETAAWIWLLPGMCLGIRLATETNIEKRKVAALENSSRG